MKQAKMLIVPVLVLIMILNLAACGTRVNLQTEKDAIEYLKDYVDERGKSSTIADTLGLYYSVVGSFQFYSTSFAEQVNGIWTVVLHGSISGYRDYNKTDYGTFSFSYVATVTTDGQVTTQLIQEGCISEINFS